MRLEAVVSQPPCKCDDGTVCIDLLAHVNTYIYDLLPDSITPHPDFAFPFFPT